MREDNSILNYHIVAFDLLYNLPYHEINIICQKINKNEKICDNIIEMLFICLKTNLKTKFFYK